MSEFDFLLPEAFWMEQIIAAGITAVVTLLVALLAVGPKIENIGKDIKNQTNHLEGRADGLERDHQDIRREQQVVRQDIAQVAGVAAFLRDAQMKEEARRENLQGQQLDAQKVIDTLTVLMDHVADLERENKELREENAKLRERLTPFSQSWRPASEQDEEPEM